MFPGYQVFNLMFRENVKVNGLVPGIRGSLARAPLRRRPLRPRERRRLVEGRGLRPDGVGRQDDAAARESTVVYLNLRFGAKLMILI